MKAARTPKGDAFVQAERERRMGQQAEPEEIEYGTKDPMLLSLQADLTIMMASAVAEGDDHVTGYRIKTGAIHRIIGDMQAAGYPVNLPTRARIAGQEKKETDHG